MSAPSFRRKPTGIAAHHHEWMALVDVSGPFLSTAVLGRVFPQGLDDVPTELRGRLRLAHEEWRDDQEGLKADPAMHAAWIRYVFRELLGFEARDVVEGQALPPSARVSLPQHREQLAPTFAITHEDRLRLLVQVEPPTQELDRVVTDDRPWKASPAARMMALLQGTGVRLGLVTNGHQWSLVHVKRGEPATHVTWSSELFFDEPLTLRAFTSLLSIRRFLGVQEGETIEALFDESARNQHEVTEQLGVQTRRAVEVLIQTIDRIDRGRRGQLLEGLSETVLYEAAITVMMRLVFLLAAEDRGLLLKGSALWDQGYSVATLRDQLQERADRMGEEVLERRHDAWARLCATFRAVYGGIDHEDLRLPPYGGSLFDPDRFPFLEGRVPGTSWTDPVQAAATPLSIDDRTVLDLLRSLQELEVAGSGGAERRVVSFKGLDVEQIGHVYEGLLDHTAKRAEGLTLSLAGKHEPEIPIEELERRRKKDPDGLVQWLAEETGKSASAIAKALEYQPGKEEKRRLLVACENRSAVYGRVEPWAGLVRNDTKDLPVVLAEGAVYVTAGAERRSTGTHYTPKSLTEPVVRYTLEPLVYEGPAEGKPPEEWRLRSPKEILALRVCDLAMGSGAFLVQSCRYLSERLVESWAKEELAAGHEIRVAPDGTISEGAVDEVVLPGLPAAALRPGRSVEGPLFSRPASEPPPPSERGRPAQLRDRQRERDEERMALARRYVADRCLYGVDKNPWAVEMAKLSLWLITLQKDRPFTFLDHALVCGDSLLGLGSIDQLLAFHPDPKRGREIHSLFAPEKVIRAALKRATEAREKVTRMATTSIVVAWDKAFLTKEAREATADLSLLGDLLMGAALASNGKPRELDRLVLDLAEDVMRLLPERVGEKDDEATAKKRAALREKLRARAVELIDRNRGPQHAERRTLHWPLVFPEIAQQGGFDAFVGNPPFMGGLKLETAFGADYRAWLVSFLASGRVGVRGTGDLCGYFLLRVVGRLGPIGHGGLVTTNTIAQGDTRELALGALENTAITITRAEPSLPWPGDANLEVALLWFGRTGWRGDVLLASKRVPRITSQLVAPGRAVGEPQRLRANQDRAFQGANVVGLGFTMSPDAARKILAAEPRYSAVLAPYLNGSDLNSDPRQEPKRWIINFRDWPLQRTHESDATLVAADFPLCLDVVERLVKPERDAYPPTSSWNKSLRERWWQFAAPRPELAVALGQATRALVRARISNTHAVVSVPTSTVLNEKLVVFCDVPFGVLQSSIHEAWARAYSSTLRSDMQYTPSACFDTFAFPREFDGADVESRYQCCRAALMREANDGLTKLYNRFHDPDERDPGVQNLRALHVEMDLAVRDAYGWSDLPLDHGFHQTKQGVRFTVSEAARVELLDRLLELNHQRYAEEVAAGLHEGGAKGPKSRKPKPAPAAPPPSSKPARKQPKERPQLGLFQPPASGPVSNPSRGGLRAPTVEDPPPPSHEGLSREATRLLKAIEKAGEPLGKSALLAAARLDDSAWRLAIIELLEARLVIQEGERRGAVYLRDTRRRRA